MVSKTTILPRYQETDQMGVIHHSVYPVWYEVGRVKFLEDLGETYQSINDKGLHLAVIDLESKYHQTTRFSDIITLYTSIEFASKLKVKMNYKLYNQHQELINSGSTTHVWLDANYKLVNIQKYDQKLYELFTKAISND